MSVGFLGVSAMMRPSREDSVALDWRPAAQAALTAMSTDALGAWELVPTDGTEPLRSLTALVDSDTGHDRVSVPLVLPDGRLFATLRTSTLARDEPPSSVTGPLAAMTQVLESLLAAHHAAQRARHRAEAAEAAALTDALTGLPNRRAWRQALQIEDARSARSESVTLLAVVDLDGLKAVNDTEGHLAGDVLLRVTAATLREAVRTEDVLARVGGDEFNVMAVDYRPPVASVLVDRLRTALEDADIPASIGAAVRSRAETLAEALHRADLAMYDDKATRHPHR
jgi:diguanylate cyclase (GGDEF)-like protein